MITYEPHRPGVAEILKVTLRPMVDRAATDIANNVRSQRGGMDVVVNTYTTDRAAASVTIREPEARLLQVRDGILTRAAGSIGAQIRLR